jgi:hypothetical protein
MVLCQGAVTLVSAANGNEHDKLWKIGRCSDEDELEQAGTWVALLY